MLIKAGLDVNACDDQNWTPLHCACQEGLLPVIDLLISSKADCKAKTARGTTPLHVLLGCKVLPEDMTVYCKLLEDMRTNGVDLDGADNSGETPLHVASVSGCEKGVLWLIHHGVDLDQTTKRGDTPLHYAVTSGYIDIVSILLKSGADITLKSVRGTAKEIAQERRHEKIIALLQEQENSARFKKKTSNQTFTISINGKQFTVDAVQQQISLLDESLVQLNTELKPLLVDRKGQNTKRARELTELISTTTVLRNAMDLNSFAFNKQFAEDNRVWEGYLHYKSELNKESEFNQWPRYWFRMEDDKFAYYSSENALDNPLGAISLCDNFSFRLIQNQPKIFSIVRFISAMKNNEDTFYSETEIAPCLRVLISNTGKAIQHVGSKALNTELPVLKQSNETPPLRDKAMRKPSTVDIVIARQSKTLSPLRRIGTKTPGRNGSPDGLQYSDDESDDGILQCGNLKDAAFSELFSPHIMIEVNATTNTNQFSGGTISDVLHYLLLHSTALSYNPETQAFFIGYHKFVQVPDIVNEIKNVYELQKTAELPLPYSFFPAPKRLKNFTEQFIRAPFITEDPQAEIQARYNLIEYCSSQLGEPQTITELHKLLENVEKKYEALKVKALCDLQSLLGESESTAANVKSFQILDYEPEILASQFVLINSDVYRQLQVAEFIDLRWSKKSYNTPGLYKISAMSNRLYFLVATTVLSYEKSEDRIAAIKHWISVVEYTYKLRDYNTMVQLVQGLNEISILRLKHLQQGLSAKWTEKYEKLKSAVSGDANYKKYRSQDMTAPCMPFVAVYLKDLTYIYDGNPDWYDKPSNVINFNKLRKILSIIANLNIDQPERTTYSDLVLHPELAQTLLKIQPLTQTQLYERSLSIQAAVEQNDTDSTDPMAQIDKLLKEISDLKEELKKKNAEIAKKDKQLVRSQTKKSFALVKRKKESSGRLETGSLTLEEAVSLWKAERQMNLALKTKLQQINTQLARQEGQDMSIDSPTQSPSSSTTTTPTQSPRGGEMDHDAFFAGDD